MTYNYCAIKKSQQMVFLGLKTERGLDYHYFWSLYRYCFTCFDVAFWSLHIRLDKCCEEAFSCNYAYFAELNEMLEPEEIHQKLLVWQIINNLRKETEMKWNYYQFLFSWINFDLLKVIFKTSATSETPSSSLSNQQVTWASSTSK